MNLHIRDPRARELAEKLADVRNVSITEAVVDALQAELQRTMDKPQSADRSTLEREPARSRAELVEQLHKYHGLIGSDIKFDRDEANAR